MIGTEPGPPGAGGLKPPRDVAEDPLNLNADPLAAATHLVLVPVPDLGNVYASRNGTGTWQPISSTPFGRPTRVAADCEHIGVTDFTNNVVTIFNEKPPKKSVVGTLKLRVKSPGGRKVKVKQRIRIRVAH